MKNARIGSDLDDFLEEEGLLKICESGALRIAGRRTTHQGNALDILRNRAKLRLMSEQLQYLTNEKGKKTAVVMPIEEYEKLLEDLEDLAVIADRRSEATIPHEEFKRSLKRDGISR